MGTDSRIKRLSSQSTDMLAEVIKKFDAAVPAYASLVTRLGTMIGASKDSKTIHSFLKSAVEPTSGFINELESAFIRRACRRA